MANIANSCRKWIAFAVLSFFVVTGVSAEEGNAAFIAVDVANIREKPAADAPIVGRIQMNQKIMVQKTDSGWTSIKYFGPKEYGYSTTEAIVEGWVSSSLLGKQTISSKEMIDSVTKASSPEIRKKWADRLVMAFPAADAHWKLLLKAAKELGDTASCKRAEVHLNGKEDIYLAMSVENNLKLLGKIDSLGAFTSYMWDIPGYVSDSMTYNKMQRPGLDKHLAYVLATCNWGNYTASFAAGITDTEFFQDGDLQYVTFGACPKDTILASSPYVPGKRRGSGNASLDVLNNCRKELLRSTESDTFSIFTCIENSNRKKDMSSEEQKQYWDVHKLLTVKPYPDMNLFEMQATFPYEIMQKGESYFTFETLTGLFNEKGKKIYPPYSGRSYISGDLNFFTFPKRKDGRVYTVYTYKYFFGSGEYFCYDLLCFKDGKEMKHFPIKKYWGGD